ncbi:YABBY protein [Quillaja saponaria]|uniref:YABBY protein n=1 Tax=Quillaja saponaria TaxID=32244 RepID=A0AAD7KY32_QUISA|nr:YABBY protein [Quillaja saponaria]
MSMEVMASERVCYVHCNFCSTVLAVSVPCSSMLNIVTVRCGHCANLLSVNMGGSLQTVPPLDPQLQNQQQSSEDSSNKECGSSSKCHKFAAFESVEHEQPRMPPIRRKSPSVSMSPEKSKRVPSAYNRFIKEEIQRIKAGNPDISHREAF